MNFAYFRSIGALVALTTLGFTSGFAAETATVSAGTINVRGRAGFIGEVITKLNRGDTVTILDDVTISNPKAGEPANWLKIALPANTPVWVHGSFVDPATQTINANRLKVRGGPGINYSVLGFIDQGTPVKEIRRSGEWVEIEPPEGLGAYIAASLVNRTGSPATPQAETAPALAQESTTPSPVTEPATETTTPAPETSKPAQPSTVLETEKPVATDKTTEVPPAEDIGTPAPATTPQITAPSTTPPSTATIVAEPAPAIATAPMETTRELTPEERANQVLEQRTRDSQRWEVSIEPDESLLKELPEHRRQVVREGKVRRAMSIQAPGDYTLEHVETGLRLNYLYTSSTNIPLKELLGVKVRIKGEEGIDPRWPGTPVLLIKSLEVLP